MLIASCKKSNFILVKITRNTMVKSIILWNNVHTARILGNVT